MTPDDLRRAAEWSDARAAECRAAGFTEITFHQGFPLVKIPPGRRVEFLKLKLGASNNKTIYKEGVLISPL